MAATLERPIRGALAAIIKATQRLNPVMELDVDVLAVTRAAVASTSADWAAGTLTSTSADPNTGLLRLAPSAPASLFSQTAAHSVQHKFKDSSNGAEEYALDFFPDPSVTQGVSFTLDSLTLWLNAANLKGFFRVVVSYYDQNWRRVPMGDPIDILSGDVIAAQVAAGDVLFTNGCAYKIDFTGLSRRFVFEAGSQNTVTGNGRDSSGNARLQGTSTRFPGMSILATTARGLSISIQPMGKNFDTAWIGLVPTATSAAFNTNNFWRVAANRNCGPFDPTYQPYSSLDVNHNPDDHLWTGAVPGFGAIAVTNGSWGIARRILTAQRGQDPSGTWEQPYHDLKVVAYPSTGTAVNVLDMGATPTNPVEVRLDDIQPTGTTLAYSLKGSNTAVGGPFTAIAANTDGAILTGADLYRWYQLTTTFTPGPSGATKYASPALQSWSMVERVSLSTYRYLKDFDASSVADPVTAQSSIDELKLPIMNAGRQDFRDLATQLGSAYAPSSIEAHVFARNTRTGERYFLNSYRLEDRDPQYGTEEMTFVSGMDRLTVKIPQAAETYRYPASGQVPITNVTHVGTQYSITVGGTPFTLGALANYRMHGVTGACAGLDFKILAAPSNTTSIFAITVASGAIPAIGDTIEIHSDITTRVGASYVGQDFAAVYANLLSVQAAVPARYRGNLPTTTGRVTSYTLPADGAKALDVLQDVALHCGGFPSWDKGRIQFVNLYGKKESVATWDDRHIVSLETPLGADRRMPRVRAKYGYQADTDKFTNEATYDDLDSILGWGLPNLFDVTELPDDFCKWNDQAEASFVAGMLQTAWKTGVRLWKVKTVLNWPHLSQGNAVTIVTDQYTDRRLSFSSDGVTDLGSPVYGRTTAVAVIVGKNLWGNEFIVAVRGLDQVTSAAVTQSGAKAVAGTTVFNPPAPFVTQLNTEVDDTVRNLSFNATSGSGGGGTNLTYDIRLKTGFAAEASLSSGNATAFPLTLSIARDAQYDGAGVFIVTDAITGLVARVFFSVPAQRGEVTKISGQVRFRRIINYDDGNKAAAADPSDVTGQTLTSGAKESGSRLVNRLLAKTLSGDPDSLDGTPEGSSYKRINANAVGTSGFIDMGGTAWSNRHSGNLARSAGDGTAISTIVNNISNASHAGSLMQESGGKTLNRLLGKALAADPDSLDGAPDGTTYKRVVSVNASGRVPLAGMSILRFRGHQAAALSVTNNTTLGAHIDTVDEDPNSLWDGIVSVTTPADAASYIWFVHARIQWASNVTGQRLLSIRDASARSETSSDSHSFTDPDSGLATGPWMESQYIGPLSAGASLRPYGWQNSGGALNITKAFLEVMAFRLT